MLANISPTFCQRFWRQKPMDTSMLVKCWRDVGAVCASLKPSMVNTLHGRHATQYDETHATQKHFLRRNSGNSKAFLRQNSHHTKAFSLGETHANQKHFLTAKLRPLKSINHGRINAIREHFLTAKLRALKTIFYAETQAIHKHFLTANIRAVKTFLRGNSRHSKAFLLTAKLRALKSIFTAGRFTFHWNFSLSEYFFADLPSVLSLIENSTTQVFPSTTDGRGRHLMKTAPLLNHLLAIVTDYGIPNLQHILQRLVLS